MLPQKQKFNKSKRFDYSKKNYSNPFFRKKKKRKIQKESLSWKYKIIIILLTLLIIISIWFCCFSSFFNIDNIKINGAEKLNPADIENLAYEYTNKKIFFIIKQNNYFLVNTKRLIELINEKYFLENINIEKKFPDTIIINFKEKIYSVIWHENDKYYYTDLNGNIISETNIEEAELKDYPIIQNRGDSKIIDNKINEQANIISYSIELFKQFKNKKHGFEIKNFNITNETNTIRMKIKDGPEIYFNVLNDLDTQINKLVILINEKIENDYLNKEYIDLRYGDRVYYR